MTTSNRRHTFSARRLCLLAIVPLGFLVALPTILSAQSVPRSLESPPAQPPQTSPHGEKLPGMPKFHDPAPYDFDEHTGYKQIFDTKSLAGGTRTPLSGMSRTALWWERRWRASRKGNNYIVYRGEKARDFDLKLRMKIEKGGGEEFSTAASPVYLGHDRNPPACRRTT